MHYLKNIKLGLLIHSLILTTQVCKRVKARTKEISKDLKMKKCLKSLDLTSELSG